jgi:hypothetical protein
VFLHSKFVFRGAKISHFCGIQNQGKEKKAGKETRYRLVFLFYGPIFSFFKPEKYDLDT